MLTLTETKEFLRVFHSEDDALIESLILSAEDEVRQFLDWPADEESSETVWPASVSLAAKFLVQASYAVMPDDQVILRQIAETKLMPHRQRFGP